MSYQPVGVLINKLYVYVFVSLSICVFHFPDRLTDLRKIFVELIDASKEVGLEISVEEIIVCCRLVIRMQLKIRK
jgi:hypothetical protein